MAGQQLLLELVTDARIDGAIAVLQLVLLIVLALVQPTTRCRLGNPYRRGGRGSSPPSRSRGQLP